MAASVDSELMRSKLTVPSVFCQARKSPLATRLFAGPGSVRRLRTDWLAAAEDATVVRPMGAIVVMVCAVPCAVYTSDMMRAKHLSRGGTSALMSVPNVWDVLPRPLPPIGFKPFRSGMVVPCEVPARGGVTTPRWSRW